MNNLASGPFVTTIGPDFEKNPLPIDTDTNLHYLFLVKLCHTDSITLGSV